MADYSKFYEAREIVSHILEQDFVGPVTKDECLAELPVQYYIMGKLYPQKDTVEALDLARNPLLENEIETYDASISLSNQNNPSSMGITVTLKAGVSTIYISGSYAFYVPIPLAEAQLHGINTQLDAMINKLRKEAHAMNWKLHTNCRNTKQIANANILMTNIPNQGKPTVSGPQVEYESYNGKTDERQKINSIVRKIKDDGAIGSDFVILSRYTLSNPQNGLGFSGLDKDLGVLKTTGPLWKARKNDVRFSTISGFKGLESKIVIMTDVDHFSNEDARLLNYVAASRACAMLYVLYDCNAEQERQNMILSGFTLVGS